jgi:hypothetical protein
MSDHRFELFHLTVGEVNRRVTFGDFSPPLAFKRAGDSRRTGGHKPALNLLVYIRDQLIG